jgi:transposase
MAKILFWLSDEAWKALSPHLPRGRPGKPRVDDRTVISGILHVLKTGCRWRDVPPVYGPPTTIYNRYNRWSQRRVWHNACSRRWRPLAPFPTSFRSTAAMSKRTARRAAQKGGV